METLHRNKFWLAIVLVIICFAFFVGIKANTPRSARAPEAKETIKIGVIAPLTGPASIFGNALVKALALAKEDLGSTRYTYEFVIEDDETNPAKKLANVDRVHAIIVATSGTGQAAKKVVQAAKIPLLCVACTDTSVADGVYAYTNSVLPSDEGTAVATEAKKRGVRTVALLTQIHPGVNAAAEGVKAAILEQGMQIVYEERFDGNVRDFKTMIAKAKASNADLYFIRSLPPSLEIIGEELRNLGVATLAGGGGAFAISAKPEIFEGMWYQDGALTNPAFPERFQRSFPSIRYNALAAPHGYDSFMLIVQGIESGKSLSQFLQEVSEFKGIGGHLQKVPSTGNFRAPAAVWTIKDGRAKLLSSES